MFYNFFNSLTKKDKMKNDRMVGTTFQYINQHSNMKIAGITWNKANQREKHQGEAEGVVFLQHATGFCKEVWVDVAGELLKHLDWPVVACDARNHGDSSHSGSFDLRHITEEHLYLFEHILDPGHKKIRIGIGHSMGGATLAMAEVVKPHFFDLLVLIEPVSFQFTSPT